MPQNPGEAKPDQAAGPASPQKPEPSPDPAPSVSAGAVAVGSSVSGVAAERSPSLEPSAFWKNLAFLFIALTAFMLLWTTHFQPQWPALKIVGIAVVSAASGARAILAYLADVEALKKKALIRAWDKAGSRLGNPMLIRWLGWSAFLLALVHLFLFSAFLEYDAASATAPRYKLSVSRGGKQVRGSPRVLTTEKPVFARHFLLLPWQRRLEIAVTQPTGFPKIKKKLPFLRSLALKVPSDIRCSYCLIVRLVPRWRLFDELSSQRSAEMICCQIEIQGEGRAPIREVLLRQPIYLGADEREVRHRLDKEGQRRTKLFEQFLQEDAIPRDSWDLYTRDWEKIHVIPGWELEEDEKIVIRVTSKGPKPLRVLLEEKVKPGDEFQTLSLEINR